ncbi:RT0821/Lpp0805 family surface protein [Nitratireductor soli]|uniref:RT0821/Lpp0805 family surface protein n=1 Tax=Nitratireductor soli TaxID=1670619 RepID=UPI00065DE020|nr:RT0821/Lpp0805 family surface protein [Nitratireductor soli]
MRFTLIALVACAATLSGCIGGGLSQAELRPNQFAPAPAKAGVVTGIEGGGLVNGTLGTSLSRLQRRLAMEAEYRALESTPPGQDVSWRDAASGRAGMVRAAQPYRVGSQDCRQYTHTIEVDGTDRQARGTACRNVDGSWTLLG